MQWVIRPLTSIVLILCGAALYVWSDAWTVLHPDANVCRAAMWQAAFAAQALDPSVREIDRPRECRGFSREQLAAIAATLASPARSATPSASPTRPSAGPSATPRRQTPSPRPTTPGTSPTGPPSTSPSATPTPSVSVH